MHLCKCYGHYSILLIQDEKANTLKSKCMTTWVISNLLTFKIQYYRIECGKENQWSPQPVLHLQWKLTSSQQNPRSRVRTTLNWRLQIAFVEARKMTNVLLFVPFMVVNMESQNTTFLQENPEIYMTFVKEYSTPSKTSQESGKRGFESI